MKARNTQTSKSQPENRQNRACRIELADLGLRWGCVFLERTQILSGIQYTTHFMDFFVVEMKQIVGSFVNVILTRQTWSRAAESKRRALGNYLSE